MRNHTTASRLIVFILLNTLLINTLSAQFKDSEKIQSVVEKIEENRKILLSNPEKWYNDADELMREVVDNKDDENEMLLLSHYCLYYLYVIDLDGLIEVCKKLKEKGKENGDVRYEALSHIYLQEAYSKNKLYSKAQIQFETAMNLLNNAKETDEILNTKGNAYTHMINMYMNHGKPREALIYAQSVRHLLSRLTDEEKRMKNQYRNYSHLAICYQSINPDSAIYYIQKSFATKPEKYPDNDDVSLLNYTMLGEIYVERKEYEKALESFQTAEKLWLGNPGLLNSKLLLYKGFVNVYRALSDRINENIYQLKVKEIELQLAEKKNLSLHTIIKDNDQKADSDYLKIVIVTGSVLVLLLIYFLFHLFKKNQLLKQQENQSLSYLEDSKSNLDREEIHKDLVEMFKNQDENFMHEFHQAFPYFEQKLVKINSSLNEMEVEFCALLKLNMPTKEIAKYKNLEPKTVQNRKYRIRKKLNIRNDLDIYFYFSQF